MHGLCYIQVTDHTLMVDMQQLLHAVHVHISLIPRPSDVPGFKAR